MNVNIRGYIFFALALLLCGRAHAQIPAKDISSVVAAGSVKDDVYSNTYLGLTITIPKGQFTAPSLVNVEGRRARLLNVVYDSSEGAKNYTFGLMADSLENYPKNMPLTIYVRSVRHQLEKDGLRTHREEFPLTIAGLQFVGAVLVVFDKENGTYFRGIYATFLDGYVVSLEVQSGSEERLQQLLSSAVKIDAQKH
jgi:hypothetical protein